ncbi:F-box/LRR-repeat protein 2-like isoform X1 [Schistocerca americana]|uniref:F-box/LRR-repeat protein 2-like isoform X1 n=2 Tax=Schistocerca americana TaxID=7009 RepID=UPI001F4FB092|nr:F-box/LRR-repeat protein 2-like isoform X1 [Schistocerca americana]
MDTTSAEMPRRRKRKRKACDKQDMQVMPATPVDLLPDEMLLEILSRLSVDELLGAASRVCSRWERLCLEVAVWRHSSGGLCYHGTSDWPSPAKAPRPTICIHARDDVGRVLGEVWLRRGCVALRRLMLHMCRLGDAGRLLQMTAKAFPSIQELSLQECTPLSIPDYCLLAGFTELQALNLSRCKGMGEEAICTIASRCTQLRELRLDWTDGLRDDDVKFIVQKLGHQLQVLTLGGRLLTNEGYKVIADCKRLQELGLAPCQGLGDAGLAECLVPLTSLSALELADPSQLTRNGLLHFLSFSTYLENLTALKLAWCEALTDAGLEIIAKRCAGLRRLSVIHCPHISDRGVSRIIEHCHHIQIMSLIWNDGLSGRDFLPLLVSSLPKLRRLDLGYCDSITREHIDELMSHRKGIAVVRPEVWCRPRSSPHVCCAPWDQVA